MSRRARSPRPDREADLTRHLKVPMVHAALGFASDGSILVNAFQLATTDDLDAVVLSARETGLPVFVGVVVPARLRGQLLREVDDATAGIVGQLGAKLTGRRLGGR